jgi:hypothetical protein
MTTKFASSDQASSATLAPSLSSKPAERCRVIHCLVPANVYRHAKTMAAKSDLPFKEYVALVLQASSAYPPQRSK